MNDKIERLPCRGCTHSCSNYPICDGRLWRMTSGRTANSSEAEAREENADNQKKGRVEER